MKKINEFELNRQVFHILFGSIIVILLVYGFLSDEIILGLILIGILLSFLSRRIKVPIISNLLHRFEREKEISCKEFKKRDGKIC